MITSEYLVAVTLARETMHCPMGVYTPGLGSLVFWAAIMILLYAVRVLVRSGRGAGEMSPVAGIRMSPVPVPLSGVQWWVALLSVLLLLLLKIPVVVLSVFRAVGVIAWVGPGATSVIHDELPPSHKISPP